MQTLKRPIQRSLAITCSAFMAILCVVLSVQIYLMFSSWYYQQYEKTLAHVLTSIEHRIDVDDIQQCIKTKTPSDEYNKLQGFFNEFLIDFDLAYLEINIPRADGTLVNVVSATTPAEREAGETDWPLLYEDTESFTEEEIVPYLEAWDSHDITYFENDSTWGKCYTACKPLFASDGEQVGLLCADLYTKDMHDEINTYVLQCFILILGGGAILVAMLLLWLHHDVTEPIQKLEESTRSFATQSHGRRDLRALLFQAPAIKTQNEVESLSHAITQMSRDMRDYVADIIMAENRAKSAQERVEGISKIAFEDGLTGVRSKAAYACKVDGLVVAIESEWDAPEFAIVMIDLNNLKYVNDTYGHGCGDVYLKGSVQVVKDVLGTECVYRTGGDEFVAILEGDDYECRRELCAQLVSMFAKSQVDETVQPWERYSAAVGMAEHRPDESYKSVFKRADEAMYAAKVEMKERLGKYVKQR